MSRRVFEIKASYHRPWYVIALLAALVVLVGLGVMIVVGVALRHYW